MRKDDERIMDAEPKKGLTRRDFLKLSGFSFVAAVLARCKVSVTPPKTPENTQMAPHVSETVVAPDPAEVIEKEIVSAAVLSKDEAFRLYNSNTPEGKAQIELLTKLWDASETALRANPETHSEKSIYKPFAIATTTKDDKKYLYLFQSVEKTTPDGTTFIAMIFTKEGTVASLVPTDLVSEGGQTYGALTLLLNPLTGDTLKDPVPIFMVGHGKILWKSRSSARGFMSQNWSVIGWSSTVPLAPKLWREIGEL